MNKIALLFVGQGSQSAGMLKELNEQFPQVKKRFSEASEYLDLDLWEITKGEQNHLLNRTDITQPILLASSLACHDILLAETDIKADFFAGHSLGEYSALCASGALSYEEAIKLVHTRGQLMQEAVPHGNGAMAAILGLEADKVVEICQDTKMDVSAANFNSPEQTVIAGKTDAVEKVIEIAKERGAKRALLLPVSVPSHCNLMRPAAAKLSFYLDAIHWQNPSAPVIYNVDAKLRSDTDATTALLGKQLYMPVLWTQCINNLAEAGANLFIELGPNKVLAGLNKRINKDLQTFSFDNPQSLSEIKSALSA